MTTPIGITTIAVGSIQTTSPTSCFTLCFSALTKRITAKKSDMSFNEWGIIVAAMGVLVGIALESWEHWHDLKTKGWKPVIPKIGFAILFVSLAVEILFDARLAKESADTQLKAAIIEKDLAGRHLTNEQEAAIVKKLRPFAGERIVVLAYQEGYEPWYIEDQIAYALGGKDSAGWVVSSGRVRELNRAFGGILVETTPKATGKHKDAAKALASALADSGLLVAGPLPVQTGLQTEVFAHADNGPSDQPIHLTIGTNPPL
jgi:hypothetical protein